VAGTLEAYLLPDTTADKTQTKLRSKLNAAITAPRKLRKPNPLGQSAVNLVDSRGRAGKNATKGFGNIFVSRQAEEAGAEGSSVGSVSGKIRCFCCELVALVAVVVVVVKRFRASGGCELTTLLRTVCTTTIAA
jgi:hypothetical protein